MRLRLRALLMLVAIGGPMLIASAAAGQDPCPKPLTPEQCARASERPSTPPPPPDDDHDTPPPVTARPTAPPAQPTTRPAPRATQRTAPRRTTAPVAPQSTATVDPLASPLPTLDLGPIGTPEIVVQGPVDIEGDGDDEQALEAERSASGGGAFWIGLLIGLLIGALVGRASWGIQRRRRQQIFG